MDFLTIVIAIAALIILWFVFTYNGLVVFRNRAREAWSDIEVQLQRRYNLIPNLVETVKGYTAHEKDVFEKVSQARASAMGAKNPGEKDKAENILSGTLKTLFAITENYPQLRASENFLGLQRDLTDTEDKIQAARRFYNGLVRDLNNKIESFPNNLIAGILGFQKAEFFGAASEEAKEPVAVKF
ncbi:MAG: LemA family protein [bacterium]|nr:LemA family protein [bacterium]